MEKTTIDPAQVIKNALTAQNAVKSIVNDAQSDKVRIHKELLALSADGKISAIYDKFAKVLKKYPTFGKYKYCKGCESDTPYVKGECLICGTN